MGGISGGSGGGAASGIYANVGLIGTNNSVTPLTQYDFSATAVVLRNATNEIVVRYNVATVTNNVATAGPVANGRDQAAAFAANSWIHFYWIWNGTTLATISSAVAPPTGPTLPAGYTHWAYIGAVRFNASSQLARTRMNGNATYYDTHNDTIAASGITTSNETALSLSPYVPPNAAKTILELFAAYQSTTTADNNDFIINYKLGQEFFRVKIGDTQVANINLVTRQQFVIPNANQNIYYKWATTSGTRTATILVNGYDV